MHFDVVEHFFSFFFFFVQDEHKLVTPSLLNEERLFCKANRSCQEHESHSLKSCLKKEKKEITGVSEDDKRDVALMRCKLLATTPL